MIIGNIAILRFNLLSGTWGVDDVIIVGNSTNTRSVPFNIDATGNLLVFGLAPSPIRAQTWQRQVSGKYSQIDLLNTTIQDSLDDYLSQVAVSGDGNTIALCSNSDIFTYYLKSGKWSPPNFIARPTGAEGITCDLSFNGSLLAVTGKGFGDAAVIRLPEGTFYGSIIHPLSSSGTCAILSSEGSNLILLQSSNLQGAIFQFLNGNWTQIGPSFGPVNPKPYSLDCNLSGNEQFAFLMQYNSQFIVYTNVNGTWSETELISTAFPSDSTTFTPILVSSETGNVLAVGENGGGVGMVQIYHVGNNVFSYVIPS